MKKLRAFIIFMLIPLIAGYLVASSQEHKSKIKDTSNFTITNILPTDRITLVEAGKIISLTQTGVVSHATQRPLLIETLPFGNNFIGVDKQLNYSSLDEFSSNGTLQRTLQDGNTGNIDTMNWYTDPALSTDQKQLAFVSDRDKDRTNVLDNALFVQNLSDGTLQKIADPDPHSGGIAHPVWNPANPQNIAFDYYQYDKNYNPYSIIEEYNLQSQNTVSLTTQEQNAYQGSFSPDGKQFIFLERTDDITTVMYVANVTESGLSNVRSIGSGDFAYPQFSNTPDTIYYLQAQGNNGYDLYVAHIVGDKIANPSQISTGAQLFANSGFSVVRNK